MVQTMEQGGLKYAIFGDNRVVSRVAGISFEGRQDHARLLKKGDLLLLIPTPHPKHAKGIKVFVRKTEYGGKSIGWLPRTLADKVCGQINEFRGKDHVTAEVLEVNGGYAEGISIGITLGFVIPSKEEGNVQP